MIREIRDLGDLIENGGESFADLLVKKLKLNTKSIKTFYVIGLNFDLSKEKLLIEESVYSPNSSPAKFMFVGNSPANLPKNRITVSGDQVKYFFTNTLQIIKDEIEDKNISEQIENVLSTFYKKNNNSYRIDLVKTDLNVNDCDLSPDDLEKLKEKDFNKLILPCLYKRIEIEKGIRKKEIALFTLMINGEYIAKNLAYKNYISNNALEESFKDAEKGTCYTCGKSDIPVTWNTTKFNLKYYITDKISFASEFEKKNFIKNLALCKECYRKILEGESFLNNSLQSRLFGLALYIIPKTMFKMSLPSVRLKERADTIKYFVTSPNALENFQEFKKSIKNDAKFTDDKNNYMFDLMLVKKSNSAVKINTLIKDVPPSRIDLITEKQKRITEWAKDHLSDSEKLWSISFNSYYFMFPIHKNTVDKFLVNLYSSIIKGEEVSYHSLINRFVEVARVNTYEISGQYSINGSLKNLHTTVLKQNLLFEYLKELNLLKGGKTMDFSELNLKEDIKEFLKKMEFDEQKTAMFLIGYLVGEIGSAQYNAGMSGKPILKKIVYQGMGIKRLVTFVNEIFEKLVQYDKLQYNEPIFGAAKSLLDKNLVIWGLSDKENVFYILSGYAFDTMKVMTSKSNKNNEITSNSSEVTSKN